MIDRGAAVEILVREEWAYRRSASIYVYIRNRRSSGDAGLVGRAGRACRVGTLHHLKVGGSRSSSCVRERGGEYSGRNLIAAGRSEPGRGATKNVVTHRAGRGARRPTEINLAAGNGGGSQTAGRRRHRAIRGQLSIDAQLARTGVRGSEAAQIHFSIRNCGVAVFGKIVTSIATGVLLVIPKLCGDIVRVVGSEHAWYRAVICIAA